MLLLEKAQLTHGATWHAAGLIGQMRSSRNLTRMMQYSAKLYTELEAETGQATGWHGVGSLRVAASNERWLELKRAATLAKSFGFPMDARVAGRSAQLFPVMNLQDIVGAAFVPSDGYVDPSASTQAMARGARTGGVTIREGVHVTGFTVEKQRITGVLDRQGHDTLRHGGQCRRHVGARDRADGRRAGRGLRRRAPVSGDGKDRRSAQGPADLPRSRWALLREARRSAA